MDKRATVTTEYNGCTITTTITVSYDAGYGVYRTRSPHYRYDIRKGGVVHTDVPESKMSPEARAAVAADCKQAEVDLAIRLSDEDEAKRVADLAAYEASNRRILAAMAE